MKNVTQTTGFQNIHSALLRAKMDAASGTGAWRGAQPSTREHALTEDRHVRMFWEIGNYYGVGGSIVENFLKKLFFKNLNFFINISRLIV